MTPGLHGARQRALRLHPALGGAKVQVGGGEEARCFLSALLLLMSP